MPHEYDTGAAQDNSWKASWRSLRVTHVQEELDFVLEIFKVAYQKRKFEGPYVIPARTRGPI